MAVRLQRSFHFSQQSVEHHSITHVKLRSYLSSITYQYYRVHTRKIVHSYYYTRKHCCKTLSQASIQKWPTTLHSLGDGRTRRVCGTLNHIRHVQKDIFFVCYKLIIQHLKKKYIVLRVLLLPPGRRGYTNSLLTFRSGYVSIAVSQNASASTINWSKNQPFHVFFNTGETAHE